MKDITLMDSIFAKKKRKNRKTNSDIPKLTIPNYNQYYEIKKYAVVLKTF